MAIVLRVRFANKFMNLVHEHGNCFRLIPQIANEDVNISSGNGLVPWSKFALMLAQIYVTMYEFSKLERNRTTWGTFNLLIAISSTLTGRFLWDLEALVGNILNGRSLLLFVTGSLLSFYKVVKLSILLKE